jgi:hypothetical protein
VTPTPESGRAIKGTAPGRKRLPLGGNDLAALAFQTIEIRDCIAMPRAGSQQMTSMIRAGSGSIAYMMLAACNAPEADAPPAGTAVNEAKAGTSLGGAERDVPVAGEQNMAVETQLPEPRADLPKGSRAPAADPPSSSRTPAAPAPAPAPEPPQRRITPAPQQPPAEVDPPRRDRSDEDPG